MNNNSIEEVFELYLHLDQLYKLQITDEIYTITESIKKMTIKQIKTNCMNFIIDKGESNFELNIGHENITHTKKSNIVIYNHCGKTNYIILESFLFNHGENRTIKNVVCFYWNNKKLH